ncbi:MAG: sulfatase-like hydrolase/transferase [Puniceicoccaceae bacterium]
MALWVCGVVAAKQPNIVGTPNIVVVLVDDHAWEAISGYGSHLKDYAKTPAIDRLIDEGMRFDNFTCANSICSPSRASILTGQYSHTNGVKGLNGTINDDSPQYPEFLQAAGYQTWVVGKWHLQSQPKGYDKHMVVKGQGKYFDPTFTGSEGTWKRKGYSTDVYTDIAMDWLKERDKDQPFLLCLQFKAPHHDYGHAERYNELLAGVTIPEPESLYDPPLENESNLIKEFLSQTKFHMFRSTSPEQAISLGGDNASWYYNRHINDKAPNEMWEHDPDSINDRIRVAYQHQIHKYIRCVAGNDDNLKRVLDYLDAEGLAEDTIVIYTSDQGYWLGQHGMYDKRLILETSVRMPFVIRYPKLIKPGSVNDDLCINVDIAPTLLELAGVDVPDAMQGKSMVPLLRNESVDDFRDSQFYTYWGEPNHYGIRTKRFTYTRIAGHAPELFDRVKDPLQRRNFFADPEYAPVVKQLEVELDKQIRDVDISEKDLPTEARPYWLYDYTWEYRRSPRLASQAWFRDAKFGLFVHLNLASLCENGKADFLEWVDGKASDRLLKYVGYSRKAYEAAEDKTQLLFEKYLLENFDADKMCELAVKAEMKYITLTTLHLGRCYNFKTATSDFSSVNAPTGRDLVKELAEACRKHKLGLFFYLPPEYIQTKDAQQIAHNRAVIRELLTQYGQVAGIWFDGIGDYYKNPEWYTDTEGTFDLIRKLQPHALISFKEGAFCDEDFITPEHFMLPFDWKFATPEMQARFDIRQERWIRNKNNKRWEDCFQYKLREVNTVMQECTGRDGVHVPSGWINDDSARHWSAQEVYDWLIYARATGSNMLMNIGPRADGSIHPDDWQALTEVGEMIREQGWPELKNAVPVKRR